MQTKESKPDRGKNRWRFIALEVLAVVLALGIGEAYIRLRFPPYTMPISIQYDPALFARSVFPQETQISTLEDGSVRWPINSLGYRDLDEFTVEKPSGVTRIVILGGSSVFDPYVWGEDDWPHRVERDLQEAGHDVEVINAGVPKHATFDSVGRLYSEIWTLEPDYIVLYQCWNDTKYFTKLSSDQSLLRTFKPLDERSADPFAGCVNKVECFLVNHSQLFLWLRIRLLLWRYDVGPEGVVEERPTRDDIGDMGPAQYKLNLQTFVDVSRNIGATPILTKQARLVAADNTPEEQRRIHYEYTGLTHDALLDAFAACDTATDEVATEKDVQVIDLSAEFSGQPELFADQVHLTDEGSQAIAAAVADYMDDVLVEAGDNQ